MVHSRDYFGCGKKLFEPNLQVRQHMVFSNRVSRVLEIAIQTYVLIEKLLTPIALAFPLASTCSISAQVSLKVGVPSIMMSPFASLGESSVSENQ